jgi:hypothetical protein
MISISTIWDRTTEVIRGRTGMLATIALLSFVPLLAQAVFMAWIIPTTAAQTFAPVGPALVAQYGVALFGGFLVFILATVWGYLSLVAAASDPRVQSAGEAIAIGGRRMPTAIGIGLLFMLAAFVVAMVFGLLVGFGVLPASGYDPSSPVQASAGLARAIGIFMLLGLIFFVVMIWVLARLFVLGPVIVNERLGLGSIPRSFALTRGFAWRIFGVLMLFFLVAIVASSAAQAVLGLIARLALGASGELTARVIGQAGAAVVNAIYTVVVATFSAQLYRSVTGWEAAEAFA